MKHIMKELFYSGVMLQKDLEFCDIIRELKKNPQVLLLTCPEKRVIHHMECEMKGHSSVCHRTGKAHIGYATYYVTFMYRGYIFCIQSSTHYPFTDENYPGRFNFIAYERVGMEKKLQCSYFEKYEDLASIREWISHHKKRSIRYASVLHIDPYIESRHTSRICEIVDRNGGFREKKILDSFPVFLKSETWNDDHKVVRVITGDESSYSTDGHRDSFDFDLVTNKICG